MEIEEAPLAHGQSAKLRGDERTVGVVRFDGRQDHRSTVPARVVGGPSRVRELDEPFVADPLDSKMAVGTATEPVVQPNTVDDCPVNPAGCETGEGDAFGGVKPRGGFEETDYAVGDEILEIASLPNRPRSDTTGDRLNEVEVRHDPLVASR